MSENSRNFLRKVLLISQLIPGIVKAKVLSIDSDFVTLHAGLKSEGIVPVDEFMNETGELNIVVGDEVDVALDSIEDGFGRTEFSREKAKRIEAWRRLEASHNNNVTVTGRITDKVKGGFTVEVEGIKAFLPGSLVDVRPIKETAYLEGKELISK